jgi:hypothetical protein
MITERLEIIERLRLFSNEYQITSDSQPFIANQISLSSVPPRERFPKIKHLVINIIPSDTFQSLCFLRSFPNLEILHLIGNENSNHEWIDDVPYEDCHLSTLYSTHISLEGVECCSKLKYFSMDHIEDVKNMDILVSCPELEEITINANGTEKEKGSLDLASLWKVKKMTKLVLNLQKPKKLFMKSVFSGFINLRHLEIHGGGKLLNLQFLSGLNLRTLIMTETILVKTTGYDITSLEFYSVNG